LTSETLRRLVMFIRAHSPSGTYPYIVETATRMMVEAYELIKSKFNGGHTIEIYRALTAPDDWVPDSDRLGIYWSWDRDSAHPYNRDRGEKDFVTWLITAEATMDQIDWLSTIVQNATPVYREEREITVDKNAHLEILSVERTD
jgi:hypothetical protein